MQNIPIFTTENGVASLTLQEIPYTKKAYIKLQDTTKPEAFIEQCAEFCKAAGAEKIYACNHSVLEKYPEHTRILQMRCSRDKLCGTNAVLEPVRQENLEQWRCVYNGAMTGVSNAAYMTASESKKHLQKADGYFVYLNNVLVGLGIASHNRIEAVVSLVPGRGEDILMALSNVLVGSEIFLEVASDNIRAIRLYQRLGFEQVKEISVWYQIL